MGNAIKNLKIGWKLYLLAGTTLLGMLIMGIMSFLEMSSLNNATLEISDNWMPSVSTVRDMSTTLSNVRLNELGYLTAENEEGRQQFAVVWNSRQMAVQAVICPGERKEIRLADSVMGEDETEQFKNLWAIIKGLQGKIGKER